MPLCEYIFKQRLPGFDLPEITIICESGPIAINVPIHSADFPLTLLLFICINKNQVQNKNI